MKKRNLITILSASIFLLTLSQSKAETFSGGDSFEKSISISRSMNNISNVVIVNGDRDIDSLSGSVLANSKNASIILVKKDSINKNSLDEIKRINPNKVYILGGENTVSPYVQSEIEKSHKTERISGKDRYETSRKICENIFRERDVKKIAVVGSKYDLLSAGSYCGNNIPILLINKKRPDYSYIDSKKDTEKIVFGGPDSVSNEIYEHIKASSRVYGKNKYSTAVEIAKLRPNNKKAFIIDVKNSIDAVLLSTKAYNENADIILAKKEGLTDESRNFVKKYSELIYTYKVVKSEEKKANSKNIKTEVPKNRASFDYWNYYNKYSKKIILSQDQIVKKNIENISKSKYLYNIDSINGEYGVISKRAVMKPNYGGNTNSDNFDDESALTGLFPWDEVVIDKYSADKKWSHVYCVDYQGWIPSDSIMKVSKEDIKNLRENPFITYINRRRYLPDKRMIDMGTYLPLKKENLNSYTVYMPVTGDSYKVTTAEIPKNEAVKGYMDFSQANVIKQSLKFQGEPYGWGHSNSARDCSGFIRDVYRSFGIVMARDTSKQENDVIGKKISFSNVRGQYEREKLMKKQMAGDAFYLKGHVFMYLGIDEKGRPNIVHQYGDAFINGRKVSRNRNEITDANQHSTVNYSPLHYVTSGVSFIRGL